MAVKLLMTWDILPGKEQEYFEFVVRYFIPGMQRLELARKAKQLINEYSSLVKKIIESLKT